MVMAQDPGPGLEHLFFQGERPRIVPGAFQDGRLVGQRGDGLEVIRAEEDGERFDQPVLQFGGLGPVALAVERLDQVPAGPQRLGILGPQDLGSRLVDLFARGPGCGVVAAGKL